MLQQAFTHFINIPASSWYHAAEWLLGTPVLSAAILTVVHLLNKYRDNPVTSFFKTVFTALISFLTAAATAYVGTGVDVSTLGKNGLAIAGGLTFVYKLITSPLYKKYVLKVEKVVNDQPTDETVLAPDAPLTQGFEG